MICNDNIPQGHGRPSVCRVYLVRVGWSSPDIERAVAKSVRRVFQCPVASHPERIDPGFAFDERREQYYSSPLLCELEKRAQHPGERMLGLTGCDLFLPVLTFVFGEALLEGSAAIVSVRRLCPSFYGLPRDPALVQRRAAIEAIHELGHTVGLVHCQDYACAMHASHTADEIDLKPADFCRDCRKAFTEKDSVAAP